MTRGHRTLVPELPRAVCLRCRRPRSVCYCAFIPQIATRTRVVFLQHPRERRMPVGTARMAHLALTNSELHEGVRFESQPAVAALLANPDTHVLFPGPGALDVTELSAPPRTLLVLDGTWPLARKLLKENPALQRLPRVGFVPRRPGNYRIRKEPAADCVSTVEAVAEVLGRLEGEPERFDAMLDAFERMVDWQLERKAAHTGPPRRKLHKPVRPPPLPSALLEAPERMVVFYGEANAYPLDSEPHYAPELIQWVAERPATGERFEAVLSPRVPLAPRIAVHLELPQASLESGEPLGSARERWGRFSRDGDVACGWGYFARDLAEEAGVRLPEFVDLRLTTGRLLKGRVGGLEQGALKLGASPSPAWAPGRAGRRLAVLAALARQVLERSRVPAGAGTTSRIR